MNAAHKGDGGDFVIIAVGGGLYNNICAESRRNVRGGQLSSVLLMVVTRFVGAVATWKFFRIRTMPIVVFVVVANVGRFTLRAPTAILAVEVLAAAVLLMTSMLFAIFPFFTLFVFLLYLHLTLLLFLLLLLLLLP